MVRNDMDVQPIRTDEDYREALRQIEQLMDAAPDSEEEARLDVLATLVQAYEAKHYPVLPPDPIAALEYYMQTRGLTRKDLEASIGKRGRVTEVLNRRRALTLSMIRKLSANLGIPAQTLIAPYSLAPKAGSTRRHRDPTIDKASSSPIS